MSHDSENNSARIEREVEEQRHRVEARIDAIKDRLSPGQLLDEVLSHTSGGSQFASNLGTTVTNNPMATALLGVGLTWLIAGQNKPAVQPRHQSRSVRPDYKDYPYARSGTTPVRRVGHAADEQGQWWSEFDAGESGRLKAKSNEVGDRLGHFVDKAGKLYAGFIDESGYRVHKFQDEAGNLIGEAKGWADDAKHGLEHAAEDVAHTAQDVGRAMQKSSDQLTRQLGALLEEQPLIGGALAFAAGAALGAALPPTRQEDRLVGRASDDLRREAGHLAGDLYNEGKEQVEDAFEKAAETATGAYEDVKQRLGEVGSSPAEGPANASQH